MSRTARAIRSTSDDLLRDLETLEALELEKRRLSPDSPELVVLAARVEELAARVLASSHQQRALSERIESMHAAGHPDAPDSAIEDGPPDIHAILSRWRDAERQLAASTPGTAEAEVAADLVARLRDEYREASRKPD